jgi:hypothetical protein
MRGDLRRRSRIESARLLSEIRGAARLVAREQRLVWALGQHVVWNFSLGALVAALGWAAVAGASAIPVWLGAIAISALGGPMTDLMLLRLIQTRFPADQIGKAFRFTLSRAANGLGMIVAPAISTCRSRLFLYYHRDA